MSKEMEDRLAANLADLLSEVHNVTGELPHTLLQACIRAHNTLRAYNLQQRDASIIKLVRS